MKKFIFIGSLLYSLGFANVEKGTQEINTGGLFGVSEEEFVYNFGLNYGYFFTDWFQAGLSTEIIGEEDDYIILATGLLGFYLNTEDNRTVPFLTLRPGVFVSEVYGSQVEGLLSIDIGTKVFLTPSVALSTSLKVELLGPVQDIEYSGGLAFGFSYFFGKD